MFNNKVMVKMGIAKWWKTPTIAVSYIVWATINSATAQAQVIDRYFTVQPIQVCNNAGANCAPTPLFTAEVEKIYRQAGVAPIFLPTTQLNNTNLLTMATGVANLDVAGNGQHPNPTTINTWFVADLVEDPGNTLFGEAWVGANGVVVDGNAIQNFNGGNGRRDTVAHEIGHNFGLGHNNFGAGGANNLLTRGSDRSIPDGVGNIIPDGADLSQLTMAQINQIRSSPLLNVVPEVIVDTNGSTPFDTDDFFSVNFQNGPANVFLQSLTLNLAPVNAFFDSTDTPPGGAGSPFTLSNLSGIGAGDITLVGGNADLNGQQQLTLNFAPNSFGMGDSFKFGVDADLFSNIDGFGATPEELIGSLFTFTFSDGFGSQAAIADNLIASSIQPIDTLPFTGQPSGGTPIPPGRITDDPDPVTVPESQNITALLMIGFAGLCLKRKKPVENSLKLK